MVLQHAHEYYVPTHRGRTSTDNYGTTYDGLHRGDDLSVVIHDSITRLGWEVCTTPNCRANCCK